MTTHPSSERNTLSAAELFERGEFSVCIAHLNAQPESFDLALHLRCLIRLGRHHDATRSDVLEQLDELDAPSRVTCTALVASANSRLGRSRVADAVFKRAREIATQQGLSKESVAELNYLEALHQIGIRQLDKSHRLIELFRCYPTWETKALDLESWICAIRGDLGEQVRLLRRALSSSHTGELWTRACILHTLSNRIRELHL